jgi:hypothetical protein
MKYKRQVGIIEIVPPDPIGAINLGMTTPVQGAIAPFSIKFTTLDTKKYARVENEMRLR